MEYYNLDAIISVGYRVNSKEGVQFRKWASHVLKEHLVRGYTTNERRLSQQGIHELQQAVELLQKTLINHELVNDLGREAIQIIAYTKAWDLLLAYDEGELSLPTKEKQTTQTLTYQVALSAIESLKQELRVRKEATALFGKERDGGLDSILNNIEQTFGGEALYLSLSKGKICHSITTMPSISIGQTHHGFQIKDQNQAQLNLLLG
ncbi:RhuM family protein [Legionella shakespearei]|uniref:RhuM family protein n=1 Tax=Legionella shakespearei TaxID=45075 RepID=UPI001ED9B6A2|nr:RhuM family protein [Legionella shakespearei]